MKPIDFDGSNAVIGKDQDCYLPLPALIKNHVVEDEDGENVLIENGQVVSCWELSDEELAEIIKTKKIWLSTLTFGGPFQPVCLTTNKNDLI